MQGIENLWLSTNSNKNMQMKIPCVIRKKAEEQMPQGNETAIHNSYKEEIPSACYGLN